MNLRGEYIEISSEEEMEKASKWLESLGYKNLHDKKYDIEGTYLFISGDTMFHFNNESKKSYWKPFSVLYEEGMPRDKEEDLLSKAKRLYPIGTQYKSAAGDYEVHTVESMDWAPSPADAVYGEDNKGCIYYKGKWAEIVHEVKPIEKWSAGTYVVFFNNSTLHGVKLGTIDKIKYNLDSSKDSFFVDYGCCDRSRLDVDVKWFATLEEAEKFAATIKQSVEKKEFIPDDNLSSYVGRYLEALVDFPNGGYVKKGEYGLIINHSQANFPSQIGYHCSEALKKNNLNIRYRLMPEGFTPLVKEEEWKPQVGDWVVTDNLSNSNGKGGMYEGNLGQVWQIGKIIDDWYSPIESMKFTGGSLKLHNLRKATPSEIDFVNYVDKKEELLEQAKKKYPVGTRYKSAGYSETEYVVEKQTFEYDDGNIRGEDGKGILYREGKWAEIIEPSKAEVPTSNQTTYQPIVTAYSYWVKETHQSINIEGKKFSPIKAELIKVKQLKIN
jgi:hypothetical protein